MAGPGIRIPAAIGLVERHILQAQGQFAGLQPPDRTQQRIHPAQKEEVAPHPGHRKRQQSHQPQESQIANQNPVSALKNDR
jgi:hypothetical protein